MGRVACWLLATGLAVGCGRIGFDPETGDGGDPSDGPEGVPDPGFSGDGVITYNYVRADGQSRDDYGTGIAVDSAGRIVVAISGSVDYFGSGDQIQMAAITLRLNPDGAFDTTYQNGATSVPGTTADTSGWWSHGMEVVVDPSDAVTLCGYREWSATDDPTAYRYLAVAGQSDPAFGTGGVAHVDLAGEVDATACARDPVTGGYVLAGGDNGAASLFAARLTAGGVVDPGFAVTGVVTYDGPGLDRAYGVVVDAGGRVYAIGAIGSGGGDVGVWRYLADGTLDASFAGGGVFRYDSGGPDTAFGGALDARGDLIVVGTAVADAIVLKISAAGALDPGFGDAGVFRYHSDLASSTAWSVAIAATGTIYVTGGVPSPAGYVQMAVWALAPSGQLDPAFAASAATPGLYLTGTGPDGGNRIGEAIAIDAQHRLLIAGESQAGAGADFDVTVWRLR